jgi:hypothetical protein
MGMGPSAVEGEAQRYRQQFGASLPGVMNQGQGYMDQGMAGLAGVNSQVQGYLGGIGQDPNSQGMTAYLASIMNGSNPAAQGQAYLGQAFQGQAGQGTAYNAQAMNANTASLAMRGQGFAERFGSDLGGLALQQRNMSTVADKLSGTNNPFDQQTRIAMEDSAFQNSQGMQQLQSQLASQGLGAGSGAGAAAMAALQFNTNKAVADANRNNAVQGAQFQQQGLGMAGGLYNQMGALDLQRATTAGQLGLSGYQADLSNAQRMDAVSMANAQMGTNVSLQNAANATQTSNANAGLLTNASLQNAQLLTQASLANAGSLTNTSMGNAQAQNAWRAAGLQGQMGLLGQQDSQRMAAYGLLSNNAGQLLNSGQNMWGQGFTAQQNYMGNLNQAAQASAQGRGGLMGGIMSGIFGLGGALLGGPAGAGIGTAIGGLFGGGNRGGGGEQYTPAQSTYIPTTFAPSYTGGGSSTFGVGGAASNPYNTGIRFGPY